MPTWLLLPQAPSLLASPPAPPPVLTKLLSSVTVTSPHGWARVRALKSESFLYLRLAVPDHFALLPGVTKAVANVNDVLGPAFIKSGISVTDQKATDEFLIKTDGTPNKGKYGANAILGISMAVAIAGAAEKVN